VTTLYKKKLLFLIMALLLSLGAGELLLQAAALLFPPVYRILMIGGEPALVQSIIPDERLAHKGNPQYPEHDSWGFRNESVPQEAEVVVLGDSQTYGTGVNPKEAWPRQVESKSGIKVYNMAFPGWGPVESLILQSEIERLSPAVIVQAFYFGNDLYDSYESVYENHQYSELQSSDPEASEKIAEAEAVDPLALKISRLFHGKPKTASLADSIRGVLSNHSRLYGLARATLRTYENRQGPTGWATQKRKAREMPELFQVFESGNLRTVFTPAYRLAGLDQGDPRIREGLRVSLEAISRIAERAGSRQISFMVLLIPTKEFAFGSAVGSPTADLPDVYADLLENERQALEMTKSYLSARSIHFIEGAPIFQACIQEGIQLYRESNDGHPNPLGHEALANLVIPEILKSLPPKDR